MAGSVEYHIAVGDGRELSFQVDPARGRAETNDRAPRRLPAWTALGVHQCGNCPLDPAADPACPAAADAAEIFEAFRDTLSYERCRVRVRTAAREYVREIDVQGMLQSLLGLVMATSGCPILSRLRGMAENHLPFATRAETLYRTTADYLLRQYFIRKRGGTPDLDLAGLRRLYADLAEVDRSFTRRVRAAAEKDANLNAMVMLFTVAANVTGSLDEGLAEIEGLFRDDPPEGLGRSGA